MGKEKRLEYWNDGMLEYWVKTEKKKKSRMGFIGFHSYPSFQ